jgi:hypothetical protein
MRKRFADTVMGMIDLPSINHWGRLCDSWLSFHIHRFLDSRVIEPELPTNHGDLQSHLKTIPSVCRHEIHAEKGGIQQPALFLAWIVGIQQPGSIRQTERISREKGGSRSSSCGFLSQIAISNDSPEIAIDSAALDSRVIRPQSPTILPTISTGLVTISMGSCVLCASWNECFLISQVARR